MTGGGFISVALAYFFLGLYRGANSNYCNTVINELAPGRASTMNGLHAMFSIGAFLFPLFLAGITVDSSENWIYACLFMAFSGCISILLFAVCPVTGKKTAKDNTEQSDKGDNTWGFFKERLFYLSAAALFFYLCAETGVVSWMVTYFTDTGYISDTLAQLTASILWIMILSGRLTTAFLSEKIDKRKLLPAMGAGLVFFFIFLLIVKNAVLIMIGIMGFGFFMAGVFPTTVSLTGGLIDRYPLSWSFILPISSLGGVIMPSVIGYIAQKAGIASGISSIAFALIADLICIFLICSKKNAGE
ncbi:MAG: MFS transporter [Lachnospiraceae bacterium]|nr:MFS transporter [Lachnospiraceae bacterium]